MGTGLRRTMGALGGVLVAAASACGSSGSGTSGGATGGASFAGASGSGGNSLGGASGGNGASSGGASNGGGGTSGGALGAGGSGTQGGNGGGSTGGVPGSDGGSLSGHDPGSAEWVPVPADRVLSDCRLDPALLATADTKLNTPWAIVRYGKLCHEWKSIGMVAAEAWSTTKTLGAVAAGVVAYQTKQIPSTGRKTGPFSDEDRVDQWLDTVTYNPEAHVAHVLAMEAHNTNLALGQKTMSYDIVGTVQINTLSDMLNVAIRQDSARLGADLEQFTQKFVYGPLGMHESTWSSGTPDKIFAYSWSTTVRDMARLGLLMLNGGTWSGQRLLDAEWIYRMTHPSFEDGNTGYGYLTWLNASSNHHYGGIPGAPVGVQQAPQSPGPCAPVSVYPTHPHGLSDSPDCNYAAPYTCTQKYDVGVWQAVGLNGQVIQGHPGLDLLVIARDVTPFGSGPAAPGLLWDAVRPAVIAADPKWKGDEAGFCAEYGGNAYAPDAH